MENGQLEIDDIMGRSERLVEECNAVSIEVECAGGTGMCLNGLPDSTGSGTFVDAFADDGTATREHGKQRRNLFKPFGSCKEKSRRLRARCRSRAIRNSG